MKSRIHVLHIDDNLMDRKLVKDALLKEHHAFELVEADNREKFEHLITENDFDIILSDFNILGFDGLQVLQIVKEKQPDVPVIIVTGTGSEEVAIKAMKMGASDYVIKSVKHIRGLGPTIEMVLKNRRIREEREKVQLALRNSEEKFRKIFENTQDVFYQVEKNGTILEISPSITRLSEYEREELIGKSSNVFYYDLEERKQLLDHIEEKGEVWDYEVRIVTKSGEIKYVSVNAHALLNENNEPIGIEGSLRDITERKQMEIDLTNAKIKAEESDRLKTSFLQNISHEIRTPMNAIIGFSEILNDPDLPQEKCKHFTDIIIQNSYQLLSIINDIVSIASIEANQVNINTKKINLNNSLALLYDQFLTNANEKNIKLFYVPPTQIIDGWIVTDETKLIQILTNLLRNALKFTSEGIIRFGYELKGDSIQFFVEDTGIGIGKDMQQDIFKRFRQVEKTATRQFGGSGLGLSISKAYVELLGGEIWVESELDKGSIFYFTIPYKKASDNSLGNEAAQIKINIEEVIPRTILIAEDEDSNFILLEQLLASLNLNIIWAKNGLEAVEICKSKQHDIDLVLMDIKMPIMDGYEATRQIKNVFPDLQIIAQTAYSTKADIEKAIASGCSDLISKPIDYKVLIAKVKERIMN